MAVAQFTPSEILRRIRFDPLSKKGSVLDVIQLVTECGKYHASRNYAAIQAKKGASNTWAGLADKFPDISLKVDYHKFPGQGQRPTPVADLPTLFQIMAILPGSRSRNFAKRSMDVFTRTFAGDERLCDEVAKQRKTLEGTHFENAAAGVTTTVDDALAELARPLEPPTDHGVIYAATSPHLPFFKLGFWTGCPAVLESRYKMYYGSDMVLKTWACTECRATEDALLNEFASSSKGGELLDKACLPSLVELLDLACAM